MPPTAKSLRRSRLLVLLVLLAVSASVMASAGDQSVPTTIGGFANAAGTADLSRQLIQGIFGPVWSSMITSHGIDINANGSGRLLGHIFFVLNIAALALTSFLIIGTGFTSALSTGHEGVALGQRYSTLWVPIRVMVSLTLLMPVAGGYSLAQAGTMYIGKASIGLADAVFDHSLNYVVVNKGPVIEPEMSGMTELGKTVLSSLVCEKAFNKDSPGSVTQHIHNSQMKLTDSWSESWSGNNNFIGDNGCGSVAVQAPDSSTLSSDFHAFISSVFGGGNSNPKTKGSLETSAEQSFRIQVASIQTLLSSLEPVADAIVNDQSPSANTYIAAIQNYRSALVTNAQRIMKTAGAAQTATRGAAGKVSGRSQVMKKAMKQIHDCGWLCGGAVYWPLIHIQERYNSLVNRIPTASPMDNRLIKAATNISPRYDDTQTAMAREETFVQSAS